LAVVHLARKKNGLAPFQQFLKSFRAHDAGVRHDLVIMFKGFDSVSAEFESVLQGVPHRRLLVSDRGFDINAYFEAVKQLDYPAFCFLNSYSRVLVDGWLEKLHSALLSGGVGLVGATGSYQSIAGGYTRYERTVAGLAPAARAWHRIRRALGDRRPHALSQRALRMMLRLLGVWRPARDFAPFPNYHLRTNAFMASRATLGRVNLRPLRMKHSAYKFESGKEGLTSQVRNLGLQVLVVGRDGEAYEPERWHLSNTFWQSREENLLVADNQTELYLSGDAKSRAELAHYAWGDYARPG
jgi:hypothetical protein